MWLQFVQPAVSEEVYCHIKMYFKLVPPKAIICYRNRTYIVLKYVMEYHRNFEDYRSPVLSI
jgi:hypothetical protein